MCNPRADNELKEEHLLNFVVNNLDEELPIDIGENVATTTEEFTRFSPAEPRLIISARHVFTPRTQQRAQPELVKSSRCFERFA